MVTQRSVGIRTLSLLLQLALVTLGYWGWLAIWHNTLLGQREIQERYLLYNEFLLIGVLFAAGTNRDSASLEHGWVVAIRKSIRQTFLALFCIVGVVFLIQDATAGLRSFLLSFCPWLYLILLFSNYLLPRMLGLWAFSGDREERVVLAGTAEQAVQIKPWLERKSLLGFKTVGLVYVEPSGAERSPFPVLGSMEDLERILRDWSITQVMVLDLSIGNVGMRELTQLCESAAVRLLALHDPSEYFNHTITTFEDDGVRLIGLREEPLESPLNRFIKRLVDLVVCLPVIVGLLPVAALVVWVVHRVQSPGPILFRQRRTGMLGRTFEMFKFRTMHVHRESEARQATRNDPRVFWAGKWLRRLSIDELPQFLNVLRGDMSVIGPRPHLPEHDEMFARVMRRYPIRKFIRPGITGWAQVSGYRGEIHSEADIQRRVEADIYYLERWSFSLDCLILLKTIKHCVWPPKTAY